MYFGLKYIVGKMCFFGKNGGRISENTFYSDLGKKVSPKHRAHLLFLPVLLSLPLYQNGKPVMSVSLVFRRQYQPSLYLISSSGISYFGPPRSA